MILRSNLRHMSHVMKNPKKGPTHKRLTIRWEVMKYIREYQAFAAQQGELHLSDHEACLRLCQLGAAKLAEEQEV